MSSSKRVTQTLCHQLSEIIADYSFVKKRENLKDKEPILFLQAVKNIYGSEDIDKINTPNLYPDHWFQLLNCIGLNIFGKYIVLHGNDIKVPFNIIDYNKYTGSNNKVIKNDPDLSIHIEQWAVDRKDIQDKRNNLKDELYCIFKNFSNVNQIAAQFPEFLKIPGVMGLLTVSDKPKTDIVLTCANIVKKVEQLRSGAV